MVMDRNTTLKISHDVAMELQHKAGLDLEGGMMSVLMKQFLPAPD